MVKEKPKIEHTETNIDDVGPPSPNLDEGGIDIFAESLLEAKKLVKHHLADIQLEEDKITGRDVLTITDKITRKIIFVTDSSAVIGEFFEYLDNKEKWH